MRVKAFSMETAVLSGGLIHDLYGGMEISATLFTGLNLERLELRAREFKARLAGASESPMTAARLKTSVVIWDARGGFLRETGLYPQAEPSRFYSGVGTIEVQLTPLKLKSPEIHWVVQWSPVF